LSDVLNLQLITFSQIDGAPVVSILYDKGYKKVQDVVRMVDDAISKKKGTGLGKTTEI